MSLAAGARLGPYEIQPAIGAGGMGEVYKGAVQYRTSPPPPVVTHTNLVLNWLEELKAKVPVR